MFRLGFVIAAMLALPAFAEDATTRSAREELERELRQMVKTQPARVEIVFDGVDSTRYSLKEGRINFDDVSLPFNVSAPPTASTVLYSGNVEPGEHVITAKLVYEQKGGDGLFSYGAGRYRVPGRFIVQAQRGLFIRLHTRVEVDDGADVKHRFQMTGEAQSEMLNPVDDGKVPEPPHAAKNLAAADATVAAAEEQASHSPPPADSEDVPETRTTRSKKHQRPIHSKPTAHEKTTRRQRSSETVQFAKGVASSKVVPAVDSATVSTPVPASAKPIVQNAKPEVSAPVVAVAPSGPMTAPVSEREVPWPWIAGGIALFAALGIAFWRTRR